MSKKLALSILSLAILSSSAAYAKNELLTANTATKSSNYWTAERMRDAKPMPMPTVDPDKVVTQPGKAPSNENIGFDGAPPSITDLQKSQLLFTPKKPESVLKSKFDRGTFNEEFSSTSLVPFTADVAYPYETVGKLFFTIPGSGDFVCSAAAIGPRVIVTAGHCLHRGSGGGSGFYSNWRFVPAYRDGNAPLFVWDWALAGVSYGWAVGGGTVPNAEDWGVIVLQDININGTNRKMGEFTGYLGIQINSLMPNHVNMLGYPCNLDSCQRMHQVTSQSARAVAPNNVEYGSDMSGGSSGGPWVQNFGIASVGQTGGLNPGMNRVVGVTSYGYTTPEPKAQGASNFTEAFMSLYHLVCSQNSDNCAA